MNGITEHILIHMPTVEYMQHKDNLIELNENKDTIAIYTPHTEGYELEQVYDTKTHELKMLQELPKCQY